MQDKRFEGCAVQPCASVDIHPVTSPATRTLPQVRLTGKCDRYVLSNGVEIPCLGFGTYMIPNDDEGAAAVRAALDLGFRHIDGAANYNNEDMVGRVLAESGVPRNEVFLTSKLKNTEQGYEKTLAAFDRTLADPGYGLPRPLPHSLAEGRGDGRPLGRDYRRYLAAFEELYEAGRVRAIGVSNFLVHHLETLERHARIMPHVDQIELNPTYQQRETVAWCEQRGIQLEAWAPLGRGRLMRDEHMLALAERLGKDAGQVCVRWALQKGFITMPKSHEARAHQVEQRGVRLRAFARGYGAAR